jgi:4-diphosphocytidyl-2-C-methyl-D-erythritol kinase
MIKAHAKINLGLYITGKRDNGYHELCSIFLPIELCDKIEIKEADKFSITATGPFAHDCPTDEKNTMFKAYSKLKDFLYKKGIKLNPIHINIEKNIPSQAGLGGGSSDAAAVLRGLNDLHDCGLASEELKKIGEEIGADVPFFVDEEPALVEGIGETTHPFKLEHNYWILLAKPVAGLSTAEVYKHFTLSLTLKNDNVKHTEHLRNICFQGLKKAEELKTLHNDLESVSVLILPEIAAIRDYFLSLSPLVTMMSGSGSSVFAVFDSEPRMEGPQGKDWFFCKTKVKRGALWTSLRSKFTR